MIVDDPLRPLLPGSPTCLAVITSRRSLIDLASARVLSLDLLPADDAAACSPERAGREPEAVAEVVELCGRLPLAIRVAAGRQRSRPTWTVAYLASRLTRGTGAHRS